MTTEGAELVSFAEAAARLDLPRRTLMRRLADGSIDVYQDGRDRRRPLVQVTDLDRLTQPTIVRQRQPSEPIGA
jgi:excisionase family DNA binding protein